MKKTPLKRVGFKKSSKVKPISSKRGKANKLYTEVIKQIHQDVKVCTGCGLYKNDLTNSHLVPRRFNDDLINNPLNIRPHCLSCHSKWESNEERKQLLDYEENMNRIQSLDINYYNLLLFKTK